MKTEQTKQNETEIIKDKARPLPSVMPGAINWPYPDYSKIFEIASAGPPLADLWELSPIRFTDAASHVEELIDQLFPGKPLLCCAPSPQEPQTRPREAWRGRLADLSFIVPNPMTALTGKILDDKLSPCCLDNTGPRRFLVVEFDETILELDKQAAILWHLQRYGPLTLVVHSGMKSLQGWFFCAGEPEEKLIKFFRYAVHLSADENLWSKCQLCRLPDGLCANGNRQFVYYFNPQTIQV